MRISENKIEEIRSSASIVDIISEYVQLRKRGKNFIGLCPFHSEKTPSFTVSEEKQIFHCFGCHTGGNVFKFLMEYKKISFIESVQELAEQQGIEIEYDQSVYTEQQSEQEILYDINTEAARYYLNNLLNDDEGEVAKKYLEKRNIKVQTMRTFGLGYSLRGWENLLNFLKGKGLDIEKCIHLGLIGRTSDGRLHDKLPGRLIFPIFSPNGRVVAFAGRVLDPNEKGGKYINSPESLIYIKGRTLYGLSLAKDEIRRIDKVILVEGYMDLISLYQSGIRNVVAVSGTALTDEQAQLLSRYTKNVVLLFDADTAGIKASMRSIEILLKKDMEVKIVSLPSGEDPDSYVNKFGKESFEELVKKAENFLEYQTHYFESQGKFDDPASATEAIRELVKPVALVGDELKRNLLIRNIAKKFSLREKLLESELNKQMEQVKRFERSSPSTKEVSQTRKEDTNLIDSNKITVSPSLYNLEKEIIKILFEGNVAIIEFILKFIKPADLLIDKHTKLVSVVYQEYENSGELNPTQLFANINDEELEEYAREITFEKYSVSSNWEDRFPGITADMIEQKYAQDLVQKFLVEKLEQRIQSNHRELELSDNEEKSLKLMKANSELEQEKKKIKAELSSVL